MRQLCSDEQERRLFAATENTVIVWSILSGELKLRLTECTRASSYASPLHLTLHLNLHLTLHLLLHLTLAQTVCDPHPEPDAHLESDLSPKPNMNSKAKRTLSPTLS